MLSDTIIDQNFNDERFASQLKKLEHISTNMSELANNGDVEKIVHLDKLRKKILILILLLFQEELLQTYQLNQH